MLALLLCTEKQKPKNKTIDWAVEKINRGIKLNEWK